MKKKDSPQNNSSDKKDFLVVGIGASAGGIKALKEFFSLIPADSGMAFVVILHLSQTHESNLSEILQRETSMPVEQIRETVKIEPNHVYVIPPAKHLEMSDGVIRLKEPERIKGTRVPIDRFFRTLAEAWGKKAVSIILSGTGTDGTLGMKHIKGKDGFAIVQDPLDAEYDGMPRSAIETKIADIVLPVSEMPEKLLFVRDSSEKFRLTDDKENDVAKEIKNIELLRDVLTLLRVRTGHDFANYKRPTLIRRIARHLQIHETDDLKVYLEILREKPDEVLSLLKNLLINVTNFFRDKEAFNTLEKKVIPAIFEGKTAEDSVRVWSAGCASGEEAYSIAILLTEYAATLPNPPKIQIFASDVDDEAIAEAREGHFTEAVVTDVSPERLRQFFIKDEDGYRIRKSIREMVLFAPHNILRDPPFSRLDLISCRNVLIYLNRETQERVLQIFHFALRDNGYLFLGASETADSQTNNYSAIDKKHRIYQSRPASSGWNAPPQLPVQGTWTTKLPELPSQTRQNLQSFGELHHRLIEYYAPPSILVNGEGEILHLSESAGKFLHFVGGEPTTNLLKVIHPALLSDVRAALFTARQEHKTVEAKNIRVSFNSDESLINLIVRPVETPEAAALIMFEEAVGEFESDKSVQSIIAGDKALESVVRQLESDLQRTKDQLRTTIEQYETTVEELKASNEELRSASEELETGKEELQSVNEELTTVNHELKDKVEEVSRANSDLQNLMRSTDIATIFLDRNLNVKRFTPRTRELFNIIPGDIGRPLEHLTHRLSPDDFQKDAAKVLKNLQTFEREVRSRENRYYIARFSPYRTIEDKIDGVVLAFIDITERRHAEEVVEADLRDMQILQELSARLVSEENIQMIYDEILAAAMRIMRSDAGTVQIFDAKTKELVLLSTSGFGREMTDYFHRVNASSKTACGIALKTGERTFVDFDANENKTDKACLMHVETGYLSAQSTPLVGRSGERIGMLNTHWKASKYRPSERELRFLDLLARQAADLIEQRHAEKKLQRAAEMDAFRVELADVLRPLANPVEIEENVAQTAMKFFKADRCYYCETEDGKAIIRRDARREDLPSVAGEYLLESFPLFNLTMKTGRPLIVEDARLTDLMDDELKRLCVETQIISFINVPVIKDGEYKGNLCITNDAPRNWAEFEIELAEEIAERTWAALERARAEEALQSSIELRKALTGNLPGSAVFVIDSNLRYLIAEGEALKTAGFVPEDFIGKTIYESLEVDLVTNYKPFFEKVFAGESYSYEHEAHNRTFISRGIPLRYASGEIYAALAVSYDITDRKLVEEKLRESEEHLRIAIEAAEMATWDWNLETNEIIWNEQHFLLLGMKATEESQYPETFFKQLHPEDQNWVGKELAQSIESNTNFDAQFRIVRQDTKEVRWMEGYGHIVEYANGKPVRMSGVMSDITLRKQSEEALRESEERFSKAFNASPLVLTISSLTTGELIEVNETFYNVTGYSREDIIGKTTLELGLWKNPTERDAELEEVRQMGQLRNHEYVFRTKSGKEIIGLLAAEKIEIGGEQFALTVIQDITELKNTEQSLRESEEWLRNLIESVTEYAIFTMTLDGIIDSWNPGAERTFGFTDEEILGQSTKIIFTPEDNQKKAAENEMQAALKQGRAADERFHIKNDGTRFYASGVLMPLIKNGEVAGFVKIARDLTAQITAEKNRRDMEMLQKLVKAQEDERRRIARDLHDELGQQLTGLRLKLEHLRKISNQPDISPKIDEVQEIAKGIDEGVDFIAWELRPAALDDLGLQAALKKYVKEWSEFSRIKAELSITGRKKIRLLPEMETNLYRITQEALNNVHKHAAAKKVEVVFTERNKERILIISDDGKGFDPESKIKENKGLGLVGMKERAILIGGNIEIESEEGKGTTIYVHVPLN